MWMEFVGLIVFIGVPWTCSEALLFEMDANCPGVSEFQLDEYINYNVVWNGGSIGGARYSNWCSVIFRGKNRKQWHQLFKVCAVIENYGVTEETFKLEFFKEYSVVPDLRLDHNFTLANKFTFCGNENEFLRIQMETSNTHGFLSFVEIYVEALKVNHKMEGHSGTDTKCEEPSTSSGTIHVVYLVVTVVVLIVICVVISLCIVRHYRLRLIARNRQQREISSDIPTRQFSITYSRPQPETRPTSTVTPTTVSYTTVSQNDYTEFPATSRSQENV